MTGVYFYNGGIVGQNTGPVTECDNTGAISSSSTYTGGIVGINTGTVADCTNEGGISGVGQVGGIAGSTSGTLTNSAALAAKVSGGSYNTGRVCGTNLYITNCYYWSSMIFSGSGGYTGTSTSNLQNDFPNKMGFDFTGDWFWDGVRGLPVLKGVSPDGT